MPGQGSHSLHRHLAPLAGPLPEQGRREGRALPFSTHVDSAPQPVNPLRSTRLCPEAPATSHTALSLWGRLEHQLQRGYQQPLSHAAPQSPLTLSSA